MTKWLKIITISSVILLSTVFLIIIFQSSKSTLTRSNNIQEQIYINSAYNETKHRVNKLDVNSNKKDVLLEKHFDDYPTSTYFEEKNEIYFTGKLDDGTQQLFVKNRETSEINKLTKDLNHVDFLQLDKEKNIIYMRALVEKNDRNFHIVTFDIQTGDINVWNNKDADNSVVIFDFSPSLKKVLLVTKSIREEFNNISEANRKNISPEPPTHTFSIYSETGTLEKDEIKINSFIRSASLSLDGGSFLLNYKDKLEDTAKIALYNKGKKEIEVLLEDSNELMNIREPKFNSNNSGFYFIADDIKNNTKVYYFNIKEKTIQQIWYKENEQPINLYLINEFE